MNRTKILSALFAVLVIALSGCRVDPHYYRGADATNLKPLIAAQSTETLQRWQDLFVRVDYRIIRLPSTLQLQGELAFTDGARINYSRAGSLDLQLYFLDRDQRVVRSSTLARSLSRNLEDTTLFSKTFPIDDGIVALAFGYDGSLIDNDPDFFSSTMPIWKVPRQVRAK